MESTDPPHGGVDVRFDPETNAHVATFDGTTIESGMAIVHAVAEIRGCDPTDLGPLSDVIDTEALDSLVNHSNRNASSGIRRVRFAHDQYVMAVRGNGSVELEPPPEGETDSTAGE